MSNAPSKLLERFPLLLLFAVVGLACSGDSPGTTDPDPDPTPNPNPDVVEIQLTQDFTFSPENVTIEPGTTVRWVNQYDIDHTVTPDDAQQEGAWESQNMSQGDEFEYTFEVSGQAYDYHCIPHQGQGMIGTITVE